MGDNTPRITECPVCGHDLSDGGKDQLHLHIAEHHGPADFGLSPLGSE